MTVGLPITNIVDVTASITSAGTNFANLQSLLIVGDSPVIDTYQRLRSYASLSAVGVDFAATTPEYLAASIFFDQAPTPTQLFIGRWAKNGSAGDLVCGALSASQQLITNWNTITNGGFNATIQGSAFSITNLNLTTALNLNGVASLIQTALQTTGINTPAASTLGSSAGGSLAATTYYVRTTYVTANGETLANTEQTHSNLINTVLTVSSPPTAGSGVTGWNVYVSTSAGTETKQNTTPIAIGTAWTEPTSGLIAGSALPTTNTATVPGSAAATCVWNQAQNSFIFTCGVTGSTSSFGFLSAPTAGTDLSVPLKGTAALATYSAPGIAAESAVAAVQALDQLTTYWYGLMFAAGSNNVDIADSDYLAIAAYIQASTGTTGNPHIFGLTTSESGALSSVISTDIGSELQALLYNRTFYMYSSQNPYAAASLFGLLLTINFAASNSFITLMWKQVIGVTAELLSQSAATSLNTKRYNYFAAFNIGISIVVNGTMASTNFIDEIYGLDGLVNYIQTDVVNYMVSNNTKVPQTDAGVAELVTTIQGACAAFVNNGYLAPGTWESAAIGPIATGTALSNGYYVWASPIALQATASRNARVSPTIQVLAIEAGAIHMIVVNLTVNQ